MVAPVYKTLARAGGYEQLVLGLTTARVTLEKENIPYISFQDLMKDNKKALEYGNKLLEGENLHPDIPCDESVAYLGLNFHDLVLQVGEEEAYRLYKSQGRGAFNPLHTMEQLLRNYSPDLVVATNSPRAERAVHLKAKELSIPSICLVDIFSLEALKGDLSKPGYGSRICVLNNYTRDKLVEFGRPVEEIVVTGNPAFDALTAPSVVAEADQYRSRRHLQNKKVILWARASVAEDNALADAVEDTLTGLALKRPDYAVIVRPHPNEPRRAIPVAPNIFESDKNDKLPVVLHASDIVCTLYSTVGIEGALINRDVIQLTNTNLFKSLDLVKTGYAWGAENVDALEGLIENLPSKKVRDHTNPVKLNAAEKVAQVIQDLIAKT